MSLRARRDFLIFLFATAALAAIAALPPILQDPSYHYFADRRRLFGIPSFFNVATNLAFLFVGIIGVSMCVSKEKLGAHRAWMACFTGVALVAFGSAFYHLAPDDNTLMWDRLPMSLGFMALSVALMAEYVNPRLEKYLLAPAIVLGLASVLYWHDTGDLRPYVLVQGIPLLMIPALLLRYQRTGPDRKYLLAALALYAVAKLTEHYDQAIFILTGEIISGHSLKHLLAATALLVVYRMLRRRFP